MRQTIPRRTPTRNFMVSGGANSYYTLFKGDPEVVVTRGNLIIPRRYSTTGRSFMSYPGQDSLSPLTFNLCFNTFIRYIADQKFQQFGFTLNSLNPTHWFQFADDAAVITGLEKENQILLNHFTRWCNWAGMKIRVDKYVTFGIKKSATSSVQSLPKLTLNNSLVPTVESNKSLKYLGRYFNF